MTKEKKIFVFITIGRTGSNYFFRLLDNYLPFINTYELFHRKCIYALSEDLREYGEYTGITYKDICDGKLVNDIHLDPEKLIDFFKNKMINSAEKDFFTFKIFPEHLEFNKVENILKRDDVEVVFLKRLPIESYISMLKARESGAWKDSDHTNIKPRIEFNKFVKWYNAKEKWYKNVENILIGCHKHSYTLYYENFTKSDDNENLEYIVSNLLQAKINSYSKSTIEVKYTMKKQDKSKSIKEKVLNWDIFYGLCIEKGWKEKIFTHFNS